MTFDVTARKPLAPTTANNTQICLEGSPAQVGRVFGEMNAGDIQDEVERFYTTVEEKEGFSRDEILRAGEHYRSVVERHAPHWLEEANATADAADVDPEAFLTYQGAKYRGINRPECFTYFSAPRHNTGGVTPYAHIAVYRAADTVYVPLYLGVTATPKILADGSLSRQSMTIPSEEDGRRQKIEDDLEEKRQDVEVAARRALGMEGESGARRILTQECLRLAEQAGEIYR